MTKYKAEIRKIPKHIVYFKEYFIKDIDEFYHELAKKNIFQELSDQVLRENPAIRLTDPDYNVMVYVDGAYKERDVWIEFCDAVTHAGQDTPVYQFKTVPTFTAVNVMHKGSYSKLFEAYEYAYQWMRENGYQKSGCPRNSAIDGFWNQANEENYLTEIQIPIGG